MGKFDAKVRDVLATYIPQSETPQLFDYGTIRGGSGAGQEMKRAAFQILTGSSTSAHKAYDYMAVAVTEQSLVLLQVKFKTGLLGMSFKPVRKNQPAQVFPRNQVRVEVGPVQAGGGLFRQGSVVVRFSLPDGSSREIELCDNPSSWAPLGTN